MSLYIEEWQWLWWLLFSIVRNVITFTKGLDLQISRATSLYKVTLSWRGQGTSWLWGPVKCVVGHGVSQLWTCPHSDYISQQKVAWGTADKYFCEFSEWFLFKRDDSGMRGKGGARPPKTFISGCSCSWWPGLPHHHQHQHQNQIELLSLAAAAKQTKTRSPNAFISAQSLSLIYIFLLITLILIKGCARVASRSTRVPPNLYSGAPWEEPERMGS